MPEQCVTGYYRCTDIWFEWAGAIEEEELRYPIKSVFSYDALVHPDHPLRLPGKDGIELSMGTFANGEARLLFSSAQVEYMRYWLHKIGLTKTLIPLPYSECLVRRSSLETLAPVIYKDAKALKSAVKDIDKMNKKLKKGGADSSLNNRRIVFERVRALWNEKRGVWCALDIEAWEKDHTVLTEFGWSLARWRNEEMERERGHFIVKEHQYYTNGTFVPENRMRYNFGESEVLTKAVFKSRINSLLDSLALNYGTGSEPQYGPVFLVFHDANGDIKFLRNKGIEAPLEGLSYILPESCQQSGLFVVDTADLFGALMGESNDRRSLERLGNQLGLAPTNLHNAGNDAHYTMLALRAMADGGPLDMQREKRWPKKTEGIKVVQNDDSDEDSDDGFGLGPVNFKTGEIDPELPTMRPPTAEDIIEPEIGPVPPEANLFNAAPVTAEGELPPAVAVAA